MAMSMAAKAAWPILWTECDDHGVFEWKPVVLKARIFPADNIDFVDILAEFEQLDCIKRFDVAGRVYGIVRNFGRYQRPKKPNYKYTVPEHLEEYAGFKPGKSETPTPPVPHQSGTGTEKSPQMKEEGGNRRGKGNKEDRSAGAPTDFAFVGKIIRLKPDAYERWRKSYHAIADLPAELTKADDFYSENPPDAGKWFFPVSKWLERAHKAALKARSEADPLRGVEYRPPTAEEAAEWKRLGMS